MSQAPAKYFGPVTSSRTTIGQFFYAAGLAVSTVVVDRITIGGVVNNLNTAGVPPTQTGQALDAVTAFAVGRNPAEHLAGSAGAGRRRHLLRHRVRHRHDSSRRCSACWSGSVGFLLLRRHEHPARPTGASAADPANRAPAA